MRTVKSVNKQFRIQNKIFLSRVINFSMYENFRIIENYICGFTSNINLLNSI